MKVLAVVCIWLALSLLTLAFLSVGKRGDRP